VIPIVCSLKAVRLIRPSWVGVDALYETAYNILSIVSFISIGFIASFMPRSFDVIARNPESNSSGNKETTNKETELSVYIQRDDMKRFVHDTTKY
jgi:hypothetical protein